MKNELLPKIIFEESHPCVEEDCAPIFIKPIYLRCEEKPTFWRTSPHLHQSWLSSDHTLLFNPLGPVSAIVLNQPALSVLNSYHTPAPLNTAPARKLASLGLLQPQGASSACPQLEPDALTAWLHVTNACNLRCTYCYVHKTEAAMPLPIGLAAVETVFDAAARHDFKTVKLKYAGGEATLNFKLVRQLHAHALKLATQTGLKLEEVVLSNGVALTHTMLQFLQAEGISLMISLDGLGPGHNSQRVFANGQGSAEHVLRGLHRALTEGLQPHLSITLTGHNAAHAAEAVAFALRHQLLFNLNFYRAGHTAHRPTLQAENEQLIAGMRRAFAVIEQKLPEYSLLSALVDRANFSGAHTHTCGAGHNYLVIDQRGGVARCQMELEQPVTNIFAADPLLALKQVSTGFQNLPVDDKEGCRDCQWRYWCAGGCPLLTYHATGRSNVKSPYCDVYRALYPELLRLEGLRLLKWKASLSL